jgi:hypothetical protein
MRTTLIAFGIGFLGALAIPSALPLAASQELVGFVSLLMAGLLPAMILTATILRGDRFSASRVRDYGLALRKQLGFWAMLFLAALSAVFFVTLAKMIAGSTFAPVQFGGYVASLPMEPSLRVLVALGAGSIGVILVRLWPAYKGLQSVLDLTVQMAELHAIANDRSLRDGLDTKADRLKSPAAQRVSWPTEGPK